MARAITEGFLPRVYIVAMRSLWCIAALLSVHFVVSSVASSADQQWPQFRGPSAGVAADDPALPDTWSPTENVVWKADVPGMGWSSPVVWGDHVFLTSVVSTGTGEPPKPGLYSAVNARRHGAAAMDGLRRRLQDRKDSLGARGRAGAPGEPKHLKNSYRLGNAGHRRRARVRRNSAASVSSPST